MSHIPVMLNEVLAELPQSQATFIDCTFGAGGYSKAILEQRKCQLYAIDQDPNVLDFADKIKQQYPNFSFIQSNFAQLADIAEQYDLQDVQAIIFDLGVSSMQLDNGERGFSFNKEARLDMRMGEQDMDAWQVVNKFKEEELADIIYYYGEEHSARRIASKIVQARHQAPINTTTELAKIVHSCVKRQGKTDPATKTFQAIRIYVNDELKALKTALAAAYSLLGENGKIVIVSFQGLEDKVIKEFIQQNNCKPCKAIHPSDEEIRNNPRARSAKLRVIQARG